MCYYDYRYCQTQQPQQKVHSQRYSISNKQDTSHVVAARIIKLCIARKKAELITLVDCHVLELINYINIHCLTVVAQSFIITYDKFNHLNQN